MKISSAVSIWRGKLTDLGSVVGRTKDQLGGSVVTRADVRNVWFILNQDLCAAEITELQNTSAWIQKEILWLNIAMADALGVYVGQSPEELVDVELHLKNRHSGLHLVEVSRSAVHRLRNILLHQVEVNFILLFTTRLVPLSIVLGGVPTRSPLE